MKGPGRLFETSVSCIGGPTCQVGLPGLPGAFARLCGGGTPGTAARWSAAPNPHLRLPLLCRTHQTGALGFRGASRLVDGKPQSAFTLYVGGCGLQGRETMGKEVGAMLEDDIPAFLTALGRTVAASGMDYAAWSLQNPGAVERLAEEYLD